MIKATFTLDGRKTLLIGLSFKNLDKFRRDPYDTFIKIDGKETDLPIDVIICSGETEANLAAMLHPNIGPDTVVHVSDKLKS